MAKLKKLGEIILWKKNADPKYNLRNNGDGNAVIIGDIKEEAINWIREFRSLKATDKDLQLNEYSWMDFFGIKEEDI